MRRWGNGVLGAAMGLGLIREGFWAEYSRGRTWKMGDLMVKFICPCMARDTQTVCKALFLCMSVRVFLEEI